MSNRIKTSLAAVNGGLDYGVAISKSFHIPYRDGKPLGSERTDTHIGIALLGDELSTLIVKYDHDPLPELNAESIAEGLLQKKFVYIRPQGCEVTLYAVDKKLNKSATAKGAEIVGNNTTK